MRTPKYLNKNRHILRKRNSILSKKRWNLFPISKEKKKPIAFLIDWKISLFDQWVARLEPPPCNSSSRFPLFSVYVRWLLNIGKYIYWPAPGHTAMHVMIQGGCGVWRRLLVIRQRGHFDGNGKKNVCDSNVIWRSVLKCYTINRI